MAELNLKVYWYVVILIINTYIDYDQLLAISKETLMWPVVISAIYVALLGNMRNSCTGFLSKNGRQSSLNK